MGIIRKQGVYSTLVNYIGVAVGGITTLFLFPKYFTPEEFGLTRILLAAAAIIVQFSLLSSNAVLIKFSAIYEHHLEKRRNDLFMLTFYTSLIGFAIMVALSVLFQDWFLAQYAERSPLFVEYYPLVYPIAIFQVIFTLLDYQATSRQRVIAGSFFKELGLRFFMLALILFFMTGLLSFDHFVYLFSTYYFWAVLLMVAYMKRRDILHYTHQVSHVTRRLRYKMLTYGGVIYLGGLLAVLTENIYALLLGTEDLGNTAIFTLASYIATILFVPRRTFSQIALGLLPKLWRENNLAQVEALYRKNSLNLFIAGSFIFSVIWVNIDSLLSFLPEEYRAGKYVILVLSLGKLLDLASSIGNEILITSRIWRKNMVMDILLLVFTIGSGIALTHFFGLMGAAAAGFLGSLTFDIAKIWYIRKHLKIQPFTRQLLVAVTIALGSYLASAFIPSSGNVYLDVIVRSLITGSLFIFFILRLKVSEDISLFLTQNLARFKKS